MNDPLSLAHSPSSSDHYFQVKNFVLRDFGKWGCTDVFDFDRPTTCENKVGPSGSIFQIN